MDSCIKSDFKTFSSMMVFGDDEHFSSYSKYEILRLIRNLNIPTSDASLRLCSERTGDENMPIKPEVCQGCRL